jgi:23S rRNA (adenine-N6)-dimethyltransferase
MPPLAKESSRPPLWTAQNNLRREKMVELLLDKTTLGVNDTVVEIGAGTGIITRALAQRVRQVLALEKDPALAATTRQQLNSLSNVEVIAADFLDWSLPTMPYQVFANIPFNLTAEIVAKLTRATNSPQAAYLFLQNKAAFRFMGKPKTTQISVLLHPHWEIEIVTYIDKKEFTPIPKVTITLTAFKKRSQPLISHADYPLFADFVTYVFNAWQPTVHAALTKIFTSTHLQTLTTQINLQHLKPSQLSFPQWQLLFTTFNNSATPKQKSLITGSAQTLARQQQKLQKWHRTR